MVEISAGLVIIGFAIALAVFGFVYVNQDSGESFFGERDKVLLGNGSFADKDLNDGDFDGETIYLDIEDFDFSLNVLINFSYGIFVLIEFFLKCVFPTI